MVQYILVLRQRQAGCAGLGQDYFAGNSRITIWQLSRITKLSLYIPLYLCAFYADFYSGINTYLLEDCKLATFSSQPTTFIALFIASPRNNIVSWPRGPWRWRPVSMTVDANRLLFLFLLPRLLSGIPRQSVVVVCGGWRQEAFHHAVVVA